MFFLVLPKVILFKKGLLLPKLMRMVSYFYSRPTILRSSIEKILQSLCNYPTLEVVEAHICENMQNTLKIANYTNANIVLKISPQTKFESS